MTGRSRDFCGGGAGRVGFAVWAVMLRAEASKAEAVKDRKGDLSSSEACAGSVDSGRWRKVPTRVEENL